MFFFFLGGERFESLLHGRRVDSVTCDMCDCQYFYELTRIGAASRKNYGGFGEDVAARRVEERAQKELQDQMAVEAELVPCPECGWINDELVHGYRQGRYRRVGTFALWVAIVGAIGSLFCALGISAGPPTDRGALPFFLFGGPTLFLSVGVGLMMFRSGMRRRIQPNRGFPRPPIVPAGTPPALITDESTGELRPAVPEQLKLADGNGWMHFQVGRHSFPAMCCSCLRNADSNHPFQFEEGRRIRLEIPRCVDCNLKSRHQYWRCWSVTAALGALAAITITALLNRESASFTVIAAVWLPLSCALASVVASTRTVPVKLAVEDEPRGVVRLRFRNADYGQAVAAHNRASVAEV